MQAMQVARSVKAIRDLEDTWQVLELGHSNGDFA